MEMKGSLEPADDSDQSDSDEDSFQVQLKAGYKGTSLFRCPDLLKLLQTPSNPSVSLQRRNWQIARAALFKVLQLETCNGLNNIHAAHTAQRFFCYFTFKHKYTYIAYIQSYIYFYQTKARALCYPLLTDIMVLINTGKTTQN